MTKKIDTLATIEGLMAEYYRRGSSMGIDELLDIRDKMAIHSYRLAEYTADAKTTYNVSYFNRKVAVGREQQGILQAQKVSVARAQLEAEVKNEEILENELIDEARAYKHDLLLRQVNKVLDAMQQRISFLKTEKTDIKNV